MKNIILLITILAGVSLAACSLPSPCEKDEYLDNTYNICIKMTERTCSYYGNRDCYDPEVNEQKNVQSWACELQDGTPACLIDTCQPNAVRSNDRHSCACMNDYYYDESSKSCLKLTGEHCSLDGSVNCYDQNVNEQTNVLTWNCVKPENSEPVCQVDSCYPNAKRSDDRRSCHCIENYYYDPNAQSCMKLTGEHCGQDGTVDCYDKSVISQKNVLSWTCNKPENSEPICQVDSCYPNATKSSDNQSCNCSYGYYEDSDSGQCTKLNGEHCGLEGTVNCYETGKDVNTVFSWACETENTQTPYCIIDTCNKNATRSSDKSSCTCNEGYYYESDSDACIKMEGHNCGPNGNYDCYVEMDQTAVVSWSCDQSEHQESFCKIDTCINNASRVQKGTSLICECNKGYYYDANSKTCLKMDGHTCGQDGNYDCYEKIDQTAVVSWNCELSEQSEPVCTIDTCITNASRIKHDNTTVCECNNGYYYEPDSDACIKMNGHTCGENGNYDCYVEMDQKAVVSWSCELTDQSESICKIDTCVSHASRVNHGTTTTCECDFGYYYDESTNSCLKLDGEHCGNDGSLNCYDSILPGVRSWKCEVDEIANEALCNVNSCTKNANITDDKLSCVCANNYYYDQQFDKCLTTTTSHCGSDGTINCGEYGKDTYCSNNECYQGDVPLLCQTDEVYQLIAAHAKDLLDNIYLAKENNDCQFFNNMREAYKSTDVQEWCEANPPCNATDILTYCKKYTDIIVDMALGILPTPAGYTTPDISDVTMLVNIQLGYYSCE